MIDESEKDRILFGDAVISELKQFEKLRAIEPKLSCADLAHRMAWGNRSTRWLLRKMGDNRG